MENKPSKKIIEREATEIFDDICFGNIQNKYSIYLKKDVVYVLDNYFPVFAKSIYHLSEESAVYQAGEIIEEVVKDGITWGIVITIYAYCYIVSRKYKRNINIHKNLRLLILKFCTPFLMKEEGWSALYKYQLKNDQKELKTQNILKFIAVEMFLLCAAILVYM